MPNEFELSKAPSLTQSFDPFTLYRLLKSPYGRLLPGAFHKSGQYARQQYEVRGLWCLAATLPLPNTTSPPHLETIAHKVGIHPFCPESRYAGK
jgi:hypothetical protein